MESPVVISPLRYALKFHLRICVGLLFWNCTWDWILKFNNFTFYCIISLSHRIYEFDPWYYETDRKKEEIVCRGTTLFFFFLKGLVIYRTTSCAHGFTFTALPTGSCKVAGRVTQSPIWQRCRLVEVKWEFLLKLCWHCREGTRLIKLQVLCGKWNHFLCYT